MVDFLKINEKIKIIPNNVKDITDGIITDLKKDSYSVLLNKTVSLNNNEAVEIIIPDNNNLIKAESSVLQINDNILCLTNPENIRHIQRREFPRVDIKIPVTLKEINKSDDVIDSVTKNLSGGGMQLVTDRNFKVGSLLDAKFIILDKKSIETVLEVLRIDNDDKKKKEYYLSGKFKNLSNTQRTALIQICFKRQLELKYKGIRSDYFSNGGEHH